MSTPTFGDGVLDRDGMIRASTVITGPMVVDPVDEAWGRESALPGMTIGGLARHLVSQPECAIEFLRDPGRPDAPVLSLRDYFARVDWLHAAVDAPENTSIRNDFNEMAGIGPDACRGILGWALGELPAAIADAAPTVYVPWQDCRLALDDFLVCRMLEIVVHVDDLAQSLGVPTPTFDPTVLDPVLTLLTALSVQRRGQDAVLRALTRTERARGSVSAF